jgi:hypothetical protein
VSVSALDPSHVFGLGPHVVSPQPRRGRRTGWLPCPHLLGTGRGPTTAARSTGGKAEEEIIVARYVDERDPPHLRPNPRSSVKEAMWRAGRRGAEDGRTLWLTRRGNRGAGTVWETTQWGDHEYMRHL